MVWKILSIPKGKTKNDQKLVTAVQNIAGISPSNLALYKLATIHSSIAQEDGNGLKESNERLEYLGDAILGAAVADYLFKKFPYKNEGFLTEIRSRLVNRESLNMLARKIGIANIVQYDKKNAHLQQVILGNTLEAIVGAIYLDKGYLRCKKFVVDKLINPYHDLDALVKANSNFKSRIIEWAQREGKEIRFEIISIKKGKNHKEFTAQVTVDGEPMGTGFGNSKKKAEQDAAFKACNAIGILNEN